MRKSFFILWIGMAGLLLFCWVYLPTLSRYRDLKTQEENLITQVRDLEKKIEDLREERDLLKNDKQYLEKVIRDELGLVKPGEVVYKFVQDEESKVAAVADPENPTPAAQKALAPIAANVTTPATETPTPKTPVVAAETKKKTAVTAATTTATAKKKTTSTTTAKKKSTTAKKKKTTTSTAR